jgi:hypothetical protein
LVWALAAGAAVGIGIHAAGPLLPALFTDDAGVAALAEAPLDLVAALQPLNAAVFVGDGVLQGAADFDYLAAAMAVSAAPALSMLSGVGEGQEAAAGLGVVWRAMAALQIGRAATLAMRYWSEDGPVSVKIELGGRKRSDEENAARVDEAFRESRYFSVRSRTQRLLSSRYILSHPVVHEPGLGLPTPNMSSNMFVLH